MGLALEEEYVLRTCCLVYDGLLNRVFQHNGIGQRDLVVLFDEHQLQLRDGSITFTLRISPLNTYYGAPIRIMNALSHD